MLLIVSADDLMRQSQQIITTIIACEFIAGAKKCGLHPLDWASWEALWAIFLRGGHEATVYGRAFQIGIIHDSWGTLIQQLNRASICLATTKKTIVNLANL